MGGVDRPSARGDGRIDRGCRAEFHADHGPSWSQHERNVLNIPLPVEVMGKVNERRVLRKSRYQFRVGPASCLQLATDLGYLSGQIAAPIALFRRQRDQAVLPRRQTPRVGIGRREEERASSRLTRRYDSYCSRSAGETSERNDSWRRAIACSTNPRVAQTSRYTSLAGVLVRRDAERRKFGHHLALRRNIESLDLGDAGEGRPCADFSSSSAARDEY